MDWDPAFVERSPMFGPLATYGARLRSERDWPQRSVLQHLLRERGVSTAAGVPLRLVADLGPEPYETRIRERGEMHFRERDWHDLFNALVWLAYPRAKSALNDAQSAASRMQSSAGTRSSSQRGPQRDALTLFDENGAIVVSSDPALLEDVRCFRWKRLFWTRRSEMQSAMRVFAFGHALLHKALAPYIGMTAHAMLLPVTADFVLREPNEQREALDRIVAAALWRITNPRSLAPLPVLGVPGWWPDNEHAAFYENVAYFRTGRGKHLFLK